MKTTIVPKTINAFRGKYYFLSNFYEIPVEYEGLLYHSNESAFQAMKTKDLAKRKNFVGLPPNEAKRLGRNISLRKDWEIVKDDYMYKIVKAKFSQNEHIKKLLLQTNDSILIEGNDWGDTYWGVSRGKGSNKLGKILMRVRQELRDLEK